MNVSLGNITCCEKNFSSVHLFKKLLEKGLYARGTIRTNRKFWPKDLNKPKDTLKIDRMETWSHLAGKTTKLFSSVYNC